MKYRLERYIAGGANRYTCPSCGRRKCFTRYVDTETGEYIDDTCGKCNHYNSCQYHYPPREYFRDHPDRHTRDEWTPTQYGGAQAAHRQKRLPAKDTPAEPVQTVFFDLLWAEQSTGFSSPFRTWLESLGFDPQRVQEVIADYYLGSTSNLVGNGRVKYQPAVFWMIDEQQRVHDAKLIAYTSDGHRIQTWGESMRSLCVKHQCGPQLTETVKVLFGLHLTSRYPDKTVCIVESEKTALICACCYPGYVWLATGGCDNLQVSKLRTLMSRRIILFPDSGVYDKWCQRMKISGHRHYTVVDQLESYEGNTDIADIILGEAKLKEPPQGENRDSKSEAETNIQTQCNAY